MHYPIYPDFYVLVQHQTRHLGARQRGMRAACGITLARPPTTTIAPPSEPVTCTTCRRTVLFQRALESGQVLSSSVPVSLQPP